MYVYSTSIDISLNETFPKGPSLKIVSTVSTGYNHCAIEELKARGIRLTNTPNVPNPAVAEIAVGLILGAARRFTESIAQVQR